MAPELRQENPWERKRREELERTLKPESKNQH